MGRPKSNVKRGWTEEEDAKILAYVSDHGPGNWTSVPKKAGLRRSGKSCRLRYTNYLRPDLKHDSFTPQEEELIINLHAAIGSRWSLIAQQLPGRIDIDVKNHWNTKLKKKLCGMGIDSVTHKTYDFTNCGHPHQPQRGLWTEEEDAKILAYVSDHGPVNWTSVPKKAGLRRSEKSCRLRYTNYLRPDLKHDNFTPQEEELIIKLHAAIGSRWSLIAQQLPGRIDNDVKNHWNIKLKKKLCEMGINPVTHKPISQILSRL